MDSSALNLGPVYLQLKVFLFCFFACLIAFSVFNSNGVDIVQTPPDLGLHCLPMALLWDARDKWVKSYGQKQG